MTDLKLVDDNFVPPEDVVFDQFLATELYRILKIRQDMGKISKHAIAILSEVVHEVEYASRQEDASLIMVIALKQQAELLRRECARAVAAPPLATPTGGL